MSPRQVEKIRQVKAKSLYLQVEKLHQSLTKLDSTIAAVSQVLDEGRHLDVLLARERMLTQIHELKALRGLLQPQEDDRFMFTPPDQVGSTLMNPKHNQMFGEIPEGQVRRMKKKNPPKKTKYFFSKFIASHLFIHITPL